MPAGPIPSLCSFESLFKCGLRVHGPWHGIWARCWGELGNSLPPVPPERRDDGFSRASGCVTTCSVSLSRHPTPCQRLRTSRHKGARRLVYSTHALSTSWVRGPVLGSEQNRPEVPSLRLTAAGCAPAIVRKARGRASVGGLQATLNLSLVLVVWQEDRNGDRPELQGTSAQTLALRGGGGGTRNTGCPAQQRRPPACGPVRPPRCDLSDSAFPLCASTSWHRGSSAPSPGAAWTNPREEKARRWTFKARTRRPLGNV